jgi:hypothetical protein
VRDDDVAKASFVREKMKEEKSFAKVTSGVSMRDSPLDKNVEIAQK